MEKAGEDSQKGTETGFLNQILRVSHIHFRKKPGFLTSARSQIGVGLEKCQVYFASPISTNAAQSLGSGFSLRVCNIACRNACALSGLC